MPDASTGRFSVRVESKTQYDNGLFIFDVKHTPYGCGTWPALWLVDSNNWPTNGEIDVMEAVNQASDGNQMTLHTTDNCQMNVKRIMSGTNLNTNCYNVTNDNAGCGVKTAADTYGTAYNDAQGGVMALEWRDEGIRVWQFGRSSIPSDISARSPDPSTWGTASADFPNTNCDISSHFRNQSIIVNIDLCGQYAGGVYADSGCEYSPVLRLHSFLSAQNRKCIRLLPFPPFPPLSKYACIGSLTCIFTGPSNCTDYVANNPDAFTNAFWEFGAFEVYKAS